MVVPSLNSQAGAGLTTAFFNGQLSGEYHHRTDWAMVYVIKYFDEGLRPLRKPAGQVFMDYARQQRLIRDALLPGSRMGEIEVAFGYPQVDPSSLVEGVSGSLTCCLHLSFSTTAAAQLASLELLQDLLLFGVQLAAQDDRLL